MVIIAVDNHRLSARNSYFSLEMHHLLLGVLFPREEPSVSPTLTLVTVRGVGLDSGWGEQRLPWDPGGSLGREGRAVSLQKVKPGWEVQRPVSCLR